MVPTNVRLHKIRLVNLKNCTQCGRKDTTLHRLAECGVGKEIWECTRTRLAQIQKTDPRRIHANWLLRPCIETWPRQRHRGILWLFAHVVVVYQVNQRRTLSVVEYIEFIQRTRWNTYHCVNGMKFTGYYLEEY
jgi:hypothetical protein